MKLAENSILSPQINLVPILDSIFILIFIFMMALMQKVSRNGIKLSLPSASKKNLESNSRSFTVSIDNSSTIFLENKKLSMGQLKRELELMKLEGISAAVSLQGDKASNLGLVVEVLDVLKKNGFRNVTIETSHHGGK